MTQNIYDDDAFFAAYGALPRSREGPDGAPEFPALRVEEWGPMFLLGAARK